MKNVLAQFSVSNTQFSGVDFSPKFENTSQGVGDPTLKTGYRLNSGETFSSTRSGGNGLAGYSNLKVMPNFSLRPGVGYFQFLNDKLGYAPLTSQNIIAGTLDVRLTF